VNRSLGPVALVAGLLYAVLGALQLAFGQGTVFTSPVEYVIEWMFVAALVLGVTALAAGARTSGDRLTRGCLAVAAAGHAALLVAAAATAWAGREALDAVFPAGVLLSGLGLLAVAIQDLRRRVRPSRAGVVLAAAFVLAIPADALAGAGSLVLAAGWLALSRLLVTHPAPQPAV
jgi:hypothetical protein